jgi:uncharacterized protein YdaU (DUF1376 family)
MSTPNWISISTHHNESVTSMNIIRRFGMAGYGIYLTLLFKLASEENRAFPLDYVPDFAFTYHCEEKMVMDIINNYFNTDGLIFWNDEVTELLKPYDESYIKHSEGGKKTQSLLTLEEKREKARKAANARWHKDDNDNAK